MAHLTKVRGRRCQDPEHDPLSSTGRIYGDHVVELRDGGEFLDPRNICLRCAACHTRKTMAARRDSRAITGGVVASI
jgi:5-methylcytosine-specific restriction enzyme A